MWSESAAPCRLEALASHSKVCNSFNAQANLLLNDVTWLPCAARRLEALASHSNLLHQRQRQLAAA
jgi:hypothetical protein